MVEIGIVKVDVRGDSLLGDVKVGRGIALVVGLANAVDLVVGRGAVVVSVLTGTGNGPLHMRRMPGADTGNLSQTLVRLARQLLRAPSRGHAAESVALGDRNNIHYLVLLKHAVNIDRLLKQPVCKLDLVSNAAAVDLDLHQMGLLLLERGLADLGVGEQAHDGAVVLDALELAGGRGRVGVGFGVAGKGLLLALVPVLVEAALDLVRQVVRPHRRQRAEAAGGLDVAHNANSNHLSQLITCTFNIYCDGNLLVGSRQW